MLFLEGEFVKMKIFTKHRLENNLKCAFSYIYEVVVGRLLAEGDHVPEGDQSNIVPG